MNFFKIFVCLASIFAVHCGVTVGQLSINDGKDSVYIAQSGGSWGSMSTSGGNLKIKHNSRGYITTKSQEQFSPDGFYQFKLLDQSLSFTVDLSQAGCGCNAALYLTPMPAYNSGQQPDPTRCGDYYCDANNVCGVLCPEIDLVEANNAAMQVTPHRCNAPQGKFYSWCDGGGCAHNLGKVSPGSYGYGDGHTIDTRYPFDVKIDFRTSGGRLSSIDTVFTQNGKNHQISHTDTKCGGSYIGDLTESFQKGQVVIFSYWGDTGSGQDMTWLDVPPCDPNQGCNGNTQIIFSNIKVSGGSGPTPPTPGDCPEWQPNTNYKIGTVVKYRVNTYTSNNDWNGSAGDPYTATHSISGWGWTIGGECPKSVEYLE